MDEPATSRYRFGPLERRGLVAGWRGGQIVAVAAGLVVAVALLRTVPSVPGIALALSATAVGVAIATWPIAGRTAEEWAPDAVRHAAHLQRRRVSRRAGVFATLQLLHVDLASSTATPSVAGAHRRPGAQGTGPPDAGVVHDVLARTYTAVLGISGRGFVLMGNADKAQRVGQWAGALASLAREGTAVHRIQWIERSVPDDAREVRRHLAEQAVLDAGSSPYRSYAALVDSEVAVTHRHEVLLAVTVHAGHASRAVRAAGGGHGGACTVLLREVAALARRLTEATVDVGGVLGTRAVADAIRRGFDPAPSMRAAGAETTTPPDEGDRHGALWPWPMAVAPEWGCVQADATWHATYWIAEWPRTDVGPDFLGPLLLVSDVRRSVAVVMEPVGALRAARRIEQARTADIADAELRRRGGFLATARRQREEEVLARREIELADGHAPFRFSGYVTVSTTDRDALEESCRRVEQAAGGAGLVLRRCYGDQAGAWTCTLPLGRGLA